MRKLTALGVVMAAVLAPTAARAQFTLGARLSYAIAGGSAVKESFRLHDVFVSSVPLELDLGWNIGPNFNLGAYVSYGWTQLSSKAKDYCSANDMSCPAHQVRCGIQGIWSFNKVTGALVPWIGFGTGLESQIWKEEGGGESTTYFLRGWEMLNVQLGADVRSEGKFHWGPFVAYSFDRFTCGNGGCSTSQTAVHTYLQFGVRGNWGF